MEHDHRFEPGDKIVYVGRSFPHLKGLTGTVQGRTEVGFLRVHFPGHTGFVRINPSVARPA